MKVILYFVLWCFVCPLWQLTRVFDSKSRIERQLSDLEVGLKVEIEDTLNATIKAWADA